MSSCLSGGGRAYTLDLEIIKSPTTSWISNSSSPSSSLSESTNSPLAISTRKPRTPRKRPNQTYNEAASILSTASPKIFPSKHLKNPCKLTKSSFEIKNHFLLEPSELLMRPFQVVDSSGFLLPIFERPRFLTLPKSAEKSCQSPGEIDSERSSLEICDDSHLDFDAESILDGKIEEEIDSIMGNLKMNKESATDTNHDKITPIETFCYGYPIGLGVDSGFGLKRESRAMRNVDEEDDWWRFPSVNVLDINPKMGKNQIEKKKKVEIKNIESSKEDSASNIMPNQENFTCKTAHGESIPQPNARLFLKLNYDSVLDAWFDKDSPFSGDSPVSRTAGDDVQVRLAQIDLFSGNGGVREAGVLRYKEKRRSRFFSKKIRYQVRKVKADQRPRIKEPQWTILNGIASAVDPSTEIVYSENPEPDFVKQNNFSYAIVVVGEPPYAKTAGDNADLNIPESGQATIKNVCGSAKCVDVLISCQPLVVEPYLPQIDAPVWRLRIQRKAAADLVQDGGSAADECW